MLDSLHRPFHRPLWIVKWVCFFISLRDKDREGYSYSKDTTTDFYFTLLDWLHSDYPQDSDGIPSKEAIEEVWSHFAIIKISDRVNQLREILSTQRERGIETKIYSTYKAASYYMNLANDKLHFIGNSCEEPIWNQNQLTKAVLKSGISRKDRKIYIKHILQNDGHFFLAMCLLHKPVKKYGLKMEEEVFKFMQRYFPVANFDYTKRSHSNYYVVRKRWIELLNAVDDRGTVSRLLYNCVNDNSELERIYHDVDSKVKAFTIEIRRKSEFVNKKKVFLAIYQRLSIKSEDKSNFVNLYDISQEMRMSYNSFQTFLTKFYQEERMERNIFFINIVSTIEQRKRFYIANVPVMKIKIKKNYED